MTLSYLERGIIMNETLNVLKERRSIRKYKAEQITDAELDAILESGTWAASGKGLQPAVMVVVQDQETISYMSRLNAEIQGKPGTDPFYGAPTVVVVLADRSSFTWKEDGCLVMGNLMNAAYAVGVDSCWIHRAKEVFEGEEGQALLKQWGIEGDYVGVGHCILGYRAGDLPEAKPRKANYIYRV